jgi:hypothetical protein
MAKNIKFRIKVEIVETEEEVSSDREAARQGVGDFSLVLPESEELNLSSLDRAALDVSYPALRDAVKAHVEELIKKNSTAEQLMKGKPGK